MLDGQVAFPGVALAERPSGVPDGASDEWYTPAVVRDLLPSIDLDPCSPPHRPIRAACHYVLSEGRDGLQEPWFGVVYMNPPYSAGQLPRWTQKAKREVLARRARCVIGLIPARPGALYWSEHIWPHADVGWWSGRICFDTVVGPGAGGGTFDSALVVWGEIESDWYRRTSSAGVTWVRRAQF